MQHLPGNLFILSAPSGAGKSSLINALLAQHHRYAVECIAYDPGPADRAKPMVCIIILSVLNSSNS